MKTTNRWNLNRIATVVTTVGVIGFPLVNAQAKPPAHAPAYGYRDKNKKDKKDKKDRDYDRDRDDDRDDYRNERTLEGVVTRDYVGRTFELRTDAGRSVTVRVSGAEPNRLSRGDYVRVSGENRNGIFVADNVRILDNRGGNNGNNNGNIDASGIVVSVDSATRLHVRAANGRIYIVDSRSTLRNIDRGDRVRVEGDLRDGRVTDARVTLVRNNNDSGDYGEGRNVSFDARIIALDSRRDYLTVRGENGRTYTVYYRNSEDFRVGQNVRVVGVVRNGRIAATSLRRI